MRLVYTATQQPVQIGDPIKHNGQPWVVDFFQQPHKADSEGRVQIRLAMTDDKTEFYAGVLGMQWIEREDRANLAQVARDRHAREQARDLQRIEAKHDEHAPDPRDIAATKGLRLWNGGEGVNFIGHAKAVGLGLRANHTVRIYACAKNRAEMLRMIADYQGSPTPTVSADRVSKYWSEGAWGNYMAGIEPEPGIWLQYSHTSTPVRVWPKEKANG